MDNQKIGKYIREQRNKLGLSQQELCEKVHVTRQAVSNWENGKTLPDSDVLLSLSKLFKVTINDILCGESIEQTVLELVDENNKKTSKIKRIILYYSSLVGILIIVLLLMYFITNYNSIKVYRVASKKDHFRIVDGVIISTSSNTYFKLGRIDIRDNEEISINKVKLYYQKDSEKEIIFENNAEDQLYVDRKGYNELYRSKFNNYKDNLYLEITYNETEKEVLKLVLKEDFTNDITMIFNEGKIIKNPIPEEIQEKLLNIYQEEKISYEQKYLVRQDIPLVYTEPVLEQPIEIKQTIKKESFSSEPVPEEQPPTEDPPVEEETTEEPVQEEINYDEIISIIDQYGEDNGLSKVLSYEMNDTEIHITLLRGTLIIESKFDNIIESITLRKRDEYMIIYQKEIEGQEKIHLKDNISELLETNPEIVQTTNDYLRLVYQEIN